MGWETYPALFAAFGKIMGLPGRICHERKVEIQNVLWQRAALRQHPVVTTAKTGGRESPKSLYGEVFLSNKAVSLAVIGRYKLEAAYGESVEKRRHIHEVVPF